MAPLSSRQGWGLLRCPICRLNLTATSNALTCANRHSFDLAREGYVNLSGGARGRSARGDSPEQLQHRMSFLDGGHFAGISTAIVQHLREVGAKPKNRAWRVLDAGTGTGHHLAHTAAALGGSVVGLGLDIAKEAARRAARRWPRLAFAVADLWAGWPVRDRAADLVLSSFAPKNFAEMARVLRPEGWLAVVYPGPRHFVELTSRFGLMSAEAGKHERYIEALRRFIGPPEVLRLVQHAVLDGAAIRDAILMGPNARHVAPSGLATSVDQIAVTFEFILLLARKRRV